jgi:DNA-binding PadR family transcriptional regulator
MNDSELAVLGLLVERPRHGYDIEKVIEERDMREWTEIGFSSIYAILARLEADGLIEHQVQPSIGQGPPRKVFTVTEQGESAWREACLELLATPEGGQLSFLLGLVALPALPQGAALQALRRHRENLREREQRVASRKVETGPNAPLFLQGMFDYSLKLLQAEVEWCDEFVDRLAQAGARVPPPRLSDTENEQSHDIDHPPSTRR